MGGIHELGYFGTMMNKIHCLLRRANCSALLLVAGVWIIQMDLSRRPVAMSLLNHFSAVSSVSKAFFLIYPLLLSTVAVIILSCLCFLG